MRYLAALFILAFVPGRHGNSTVTDQPPLFTSEIEEKTMITPEIDNSTVTSGTDNMTMTPATDNTRMTSGIDNMTVISDTENMTVTPRVDNITMTPGIDNMTLTTGIDNMTMIPGNDNMTMTPTIDDTMTTTGTDNITMKSETDNMTMTTETDNMTTVLPTTEEMDSSSRCNNCTEHFEMNGIFGHWYTQPHMIETTIDECTVSSTISDEYSYRDAIVKGEYWKYKLVQLDVRLINMEDNSPYSNIKDFRLLRSSQESNFIYLPLQISHFEVIKKFLPISLLYDEWKLKKVKLNVTFSCNSSLLDDKNSIFYEVLMAHIDIINFFSMNELIDNGTFTEDENLDEICIAFPTDDIQRPGVPFDLNKCCSVSEFSMFKEEEWLNNHNDPIFQYDCHKVSGSPFTLRRWALAFIVLLLLFLPLLVVVFPGKPVPYKELTDKSLTNFDEFPWTIQEDMAGGWCDEDEPSAEANNITNGYIPHRSTAGIRPPSLTRPLYVQLNQGDVSPREADGAEQLSAMAGEEIDIPDASPDRLYLDSDPEFHLNVHLLISYLLLFHIDSHILMVLRRIVIIYLIWMVSGIGIFMYKTYYPILLDEPIFNTQYYAIWQQLHNLFIPVDDLYAEWRFVAFICPAFNTLVIFILLSPILLRKEPIAETLHCKGDLRFFGDPFPESLVEMTELRKTPKLSKSWTYEDLLYRNMTARLNNLPKLRFWKLLWDRWVCRGCNWGQSSEDYTKGGLNCILVIFWFPVCLVLVILHVIPLFSVWANYVRKQAKEAFGFSETPLSTARRVLAVPLLFMQLIGIFVFYLMMWNLLLVLVQMCVFLFIDALRTVTTTLPKIILFLAILIYLFSAFASFEDGYRQLKSVTFNLCIDRAKLREEDAPDTEVIIKVKPYEPLLLVTDDGECSIPRRVFYNICEIYRFYTREVIATFTRLVISLVLVLIIFTLIVKFQIFEEFSSQWETMLTIGTLALPAILGMLRSSNYQYLSDLRRESNLRAWLEKITTTRKISHL